MDLLFSAWSKRFNFKILFLIDALSNIKLSEEYLQAIDIAGDVMERVATVFRDVSKWKMEDADDVNIYEYWVQWNGKEMKLEP